MRKRSWLRFAAPLACFAMLIALLAAGLGLNPSVVPSPLIGKVAPMFSLSRLAGSENFTPEDMKGQTWVLNVWASWCVSCREEHATIEFLAEKGLVLVGLNYKDQREDAVAWLQEMGDPYELSVIDIDGRVGIDWGVYGVPETFVIDPDGVILYKHIGILSQEDAEKKILPLVAGTKEREL